jgi:uncharacterized Tic20 family protein
MENNTQIDKQERILASILHLSAAIPVFGIFLPLLVWIFKKDKSGFLSFQSLQSLVYQGTGILTFIIGMLLYILSFFVVFAGSFFTLAITGGHSDPPPIFFILFFLPLLVFFLIIIFYVFYVIYCIIGCIKILKKGDFKYIFIGKKLEKYLKEEISSQTEDTSLTNTI